MKFSITFSLILATLISTAALAQGDAAPQINGAGMHTKNADMPKCKGMAGMKLDGKDMAMMDAHQCTPVASSSDAQPAAKKTRMQTHKTTAVINKIDTGNATVTLAHQAVKSLNWPAMTMDFKVLDKKLLPKLSVGKKVKVEFKKEGADYVVVAVK